jgi:hypothetical protein
MSPRGHHKSRHFAKIVLLDVPKLRKAFSLENAASRWLRQRGRAPDRDVERLGIAPPRPS